MSDHHWEFSVTLSEYPGNHERQLTYWLFGLENEYMPGDWEPIERPHAEKLVWANDGYMEPLLEPYIHDEYGPRWESIDGGHNEVSWKFIEPPTDKQWAELLNVIAGGYQPPQRSYHKTPPQLVTMTNPTLYEVQTIRERVR